MTDPHEVAAKLTKAEKQSLRLMDADWWAGPQMTKMMIGCLPTLRILGLIEREFMDEGPPVVSTGGEALSVKLSACWHFRLTPLGLAVRAILQEQSSGSAPSSVAKKENCDEADRTTTNDAFRHQARLCLPA